MYEGETICVVVPASNEEKRIGRAIETLLEYEDSPVLHSQRMQG